MNTYPEIPPIEIKLEPMFSSVDTIYEIEFKHGPTLVKFLLDHGEFISLCKQADQVRAEAKKYHGGNE